MRSSSMVEAILVTLFGLPLPGMWLFFAFASGKNQRVNEVALWQEEKDIPAESVTRGFTDAEI
jgi:hypothetical protein